MRTSRPQPDRLVESGLLENHELVGGMDEVGRGALAGPVTVGLGIVSRSTPKVFPTGLADSKQLSARRRERLVEPCQDWLRDHALGHASAAEIDALGIMGALRLAGMRALAQVAERGTIPGVIILDGTADWLSPPSDDLLSVWPDRSASEGLFPAVLDPAEVPPVRTHVKADARCAVVAAASVLAKVARDAHMMALPDPGYDWASNKGYASARHVSALGRLGASDQHRCSWHLPGVDGLTTGRVPTRPGSGIRGASGAGMMGS